MDNIRQNKWFSITMYLVLSFSILGLLLLIAERYFPNQPADFMPARPNRAFRQTIQNPSRNHPVRLKPAAADRQKKLFLLLNRKTTLGNAELVYRGLAGESEIQIDVIIPDLDPQVSYSYRFKIADARKSFRLVDHNLKITSAGKNALQLLQLGD